MIKSFGIKIIVSKFSKMSDILSLLILLSSLVNKRVMVDIPDHKLVNNSLLN